MEKNQKTTLQHAIGQKLIEKLSFVGNERVLDVGCGDGHITTLIANRVLCGSVTGIDLSNNMIAFAKNTYNNIENISFHQYDAVSLPYENDFDVVTSFACLHWIKDQAKAISSMANSLKSNGRLIIRVSIASDYTDTYEQIIHKPFWQKYFQDMPTLYSFPTKESLHTMCREAKLKNIIIKKESIKQVFEKRFDFAEWIKSVKGVIKCIPDCLHDDFVNEIIDLYIKKILKNVNGSIVLEAPYLLLYAEKNN